MGRARLCALTVIITDWKTSTEKNKNKEMEYEIMKKVKEGDRKKSGER